MVTVVRDVTVSIETRNRVAEAAAALRVLAAVEADVVSNERGYVGADQLAVQLRELCAGANPVVTEQVAESLEGLVKQWDDNEDTETAL